MVKNKRNNKSRDVIHQVMDYVSTFLPGSITYNGAKFNTPGKTTTSYYAKDGAPQSTYKFGIR